jgi:hypothetical protein
MLGALMLTMRPKGQYQRPTPEPLEKRRRRQAIEGSEAMRDYKRAQQAARDRLETLREERLAREAAKPSDPI